MTIFADPLGALNIHFSLTLTCEVTIDPRVSVVGQVLLSWGGPRIISGEPYAFTKSGFGLRYTSNLTLSDVAVEDDGEYTCTVSVSGGTNVLGTTVNESIPVSVFGEGIVIKCMHYEVLPIEHT